MLLFMTKHVLQKVSENVTGKLVFKKNKVPIVLTSQKMMDNFFETNRFLRDCNSRKVYR